MVFVAGFGFLTDAYDVSLFQAIGEVDLLIYCTDLLHKYDSPYDIRSLLG